MGQVISPTCSLVLQDRVWGSCWVSEVLLCFESRTDSVPPSQEAAAHTMIAIDGVIFIVVFSCSIG